MNEDKKYAIIGKVEIGTDEYRDLIEGLARTDAELSSYRSKFWAEQTKTAALTNQIEELTATIDTFNKFIDADDMLKTQWKLFLIQKD